MQKDLVLSEFSYTINGEEHAATEPITVEHVVERHCESDAGIAIALNGAVVSRSRWESQQVVAGDELDILVAVQGG